MDVSVEVVELEEEVSLLVEHLVVDLGMVVEEHLVVQVVLALEKAVQEVLVVEVLMDL